MSKKLTEKKRKLKKIKAAVMLGTIQAVCLCHTASVFAGSGGGTGLSTSTGIPQVDTVLSTLKNLFIGLVAGIGLILLVKSIADTAQAYQQQDSHGMYNGAKGIAAGAIMVFIGAILGVLGL